MDFEIRHVELDDVEKLLEHKKIVTAENPNTLATEVEDGDDSLTSQRARIEALTDDDLSLVALSKGKIVGFLNMRMNPRKKFRHITQLSISIQNAYTGSGLGSEIMNRAIDFAKGHKEIEQIMLTVFANNDGAIRLYERFGFKEDARLTNHVKLEDGYEDLVYMIRDVK